MKTLKFCRTASFVPMMAFLIVFFVYSALAVALFDELVKKYKDKKGEKTDN